MATRYKIHKYLFLLIFLSSPEVLAADSLGRLFLTPEQRTQLDTARAQRDRRLPVQETEAAPVTPVAPPQGPDVVTYSGVVRRSDGKSTVWINGKPVNERSRAQPDHEVSVTGLRNDGAVSVAIPQADRRASLKVGQSLSVTSGTIEESYLRRETLLRPTEKTQAPAPTAQTASTTPPGTAVAAPLLSAPGAKRFVRESDIKEADPEGGAAPALRRSDK